MWVETGMLESEVKVFQSFFRLSIASIADGAPGSILGTQRAWDLLPWALLVQPASRRLPDEDRTRYGALLAI
jgi:hypothetical protein